ncbi:PQQ-dependent sugar dehydrogenase [Algoriphagus halophytocola]|uniref:PQQ-dependent sugar dehydrogenase n=1 Tax=Algoriphagus halophytocola TaxID=2991499 RepID=A0ABY6ME48_9BACT|nr:MULTISPECIES: PQQ-dependent sugar dehydrogenase [unclassified Algoriphagus]UZD21664.1 PQQ-dependent sugar dehydrogenase [Algoriphagus sp. TR-M5]WBL42876.1 PQQ-dependent sugar dehydrogenase [Algoriphagus sp. TR-M9]
MKLSLGTLLFSSLLIFSCTKSNEFGSEISTDAEQIAAGKTLFENNCSTCHNFQQDGIGPNLSGITHHVETDWVKNFIKDPSLAIESKDPRAMALFEKFKTYMPPFASLGEEGIDQILAYLHTYESLPDTLPLTGLQDPIPEPVPDSGIRVELELFSQLPASDEAQPLAKMTKMDVVPGTNRVFVNDQRVGLYELIGQKPQMYLPILDHKPELISKPGWATGMASFSFHPEFTENGLFYTAHTEPGGTLEPDYGYPDSIRVFMQWVLTEWQAEDPAAASFKGSSRELLRIDIPSQAHGMQELTFNPNSKPGDEDYGLLFIGFGDGGLAEQRAAYVSDSKGTRIYSSILRIDPLGNDSPNGQYGIPKSNPFAGEAGKAGEVYANGFRNPNRVFWDKKGNMYATDIGQHSVEEINKIEKGNFYGWPIREGRFIINPYGKFNEIFPLKEDDEKYGVTYPIVQLDHDELAAIFAGYVMPYGPLEGKLIFGDILSGRLFFTDLDDPEAAGVQSWGVLYEGQEISLLELCGGKRVDLKFGQDADGQVYIMSKTEGKIYRIKR